MIEWKRILLSLLALGVCYANVAVIFDPRAHKLNIGSLPLPEAAHQIFSVFGVFSYFETSNKELTVWGLAKKEATTNQTYWRQLPTSDYFPCGRAEQNRRMWASLHFDALGRESHFRVWQAVGRKILARHNREYPEDPITKVSFQSMTWPRDPSGFHARFSYTEGKKQYWVIAEKK